MTAAVNLHRRWRNAAIVCAVAALAVTVAALAPAVVGALRRARDGRELVQCAENLRSVGQALRVYMAEQPGLLPLSPTVENPHVDVVRALGPALGSLEVLSCPALPPSNAATLAAGGLGYYYYSADHASTNPALSEFLLESLAYPHALSSASPADSWVMSDQWYRGQPPSHAGYKKGLNYLMLDGAVGFTETSPRKSFH